VPALLDQYSVGQTVILPLQGLLLYVISPALPSKPPPVSAEIGLPGLDMDNLLLQAGLISAGA